MTTKSFLIGSSKKRRSSRISLYLSIPISMQSRRVQEKAANLIGNEDSNVEFLADPSESRKHLIELLLSLGKLSSA